MRHISDKLAASQQEVAEIRSELHKDHISKSGLEAEAKKLGLKLQEEVTRRTRVERELQQLSERFATCEQEVVDWQSRLTSLEEEKRLESAKVAGLASQLEIALGELNKVGTRCSSFRSRICTFLGL